MTETTTTDNVVQFQNPNAIETPEMDSDCPGAYGEACGECCEPGCYANHVLRIADTVKEQLDDCDCAPCQEIASLIDGIAAPLAKNMEQLDEQLEALGDDEPGAEMVEDGMIMIANSTQAEGVLTRLAEVISAIQNTYH